MPQNDRGSETYSMITRKCTRTWNKHRPRIIYEGLERHDPTIGSTPPFSQACAAWRFANHVKLFFYKYICIAFTTAQYSGLALRISCTLLQTVMPQYHCVPASSLLFVRF